MRHRRGPKVRVASWGSPRSRVAPAPFSGGILGCPGAAMEAPVHRPDIPPGGRKCGHAGQRNGSFQPRRERMKRTRALRSIVLLAAFTSWLAAVSTVAVKEARGAPPESKKDAPVPVQEAKGFDCHDGVEALKKGSN